MRDYCSYAPEKPLGLDVSDNCLKHDSDYYTQTKTRKEADRDFRDSILKKGGVRAFVIAWIYYYGVRWFGRSAWD